MAEVVMLLLLVTLLLVLSSASLSSFSFCLAGNGCAVAGDGGDREDSEEEAEGVWCDGLWTCWDCREVRKDRGDIIVLNSCPTTLPLAVITGGYDAADGNCPRGIAIGWGGRSLPASPTSSLH
ncbi:hypothetical protein B0T14DRAFT_179518 [Immersiella caudata]|uniref:Uncharacterized protein n=1 Tax=Immersiella caudata TaxID=314043 RepID=A0AA39WYA0_9PEZI|nr:hypothetical protein B0T14DRAFT_179518 [Immersiella caudata]